MFAYLFAFVLTGVTACVASTTTARSTRNLLICISCAPLVALAGLRSVYVGTDIAVYLQPMFWKSLNGSFFAVMAGNQEPLFSLLVWLATRLTGSINGVMACVELVMLIPFIITASYFAPKHLGTMLLLYCLEYYLFGFNIMRQGVAISCVLLSYTLLVQGNRIGSIGLMLCGALFHNTAVLGALVWMILFIVQKCYALERRGHKNGLIYLLAFGLFFFVLLAVCFAPEIIKMLSGWRESFLYQVEHITLWGGVVWKSFIIPLSCTVVYFLFGRRRGFDSVIVPLLLLTWFGALLWQLSSISDQLYRLGMMFLVFGIPAVGVICEACATKHEVVISKVICLGAALIFFYFQYVAIEYAGTIPYQSTLLPFLNL